MNTGSVPVHTLPIAALRQWLLDHNATQSQAYRRADAEIRRAQFWREHPTRVLVLKCMDGRLNGSVLMDVPAGVLTPVRNLGGMFDLGWPLLGEVIADFVTDALDAKTTCLVIVTYHWSKGDTHRGCRGFNYDVAAAQAYTTQVKRQIEEMFGEEHAGVYPIRVGIETDSDALMLHGEGDATLDLATAGDLSEDALRRLVAALFPGMQQQMLTDLLRLVRGNIRHIAGVRGNGRAAIEAEHRERILGIGRGFDWLHTVNLALLVGPFDPDLVKPIRTAAELLLGNMRDGRVPNDGVILLASAPYWSEGLNPRRLRSHDLNRAKAKARLLGQFAMEVIRTQVPDLAPLVVPVTGIVNMETREFTELNGAKTP